MKTEYACSIDATIDVIGGKWKTWILCLLKDNSIMRFGELKKEIPDITTKVLTENLKELEKDGIINRKLYPEVPPKVEYSLTKKGETLKPILESLLLWGSDYMKENDIKMSCK